MISCINKLSKSGYLISVASFCFTVMVLDIWALHLAESRNTKVFALILSSFTNSFFTFSFNRQYKRCRKASLRNVVKRFYNMSHPHPATRDILVSSEQDFDRKRGSKFISDIPETDPTCSKHPCITSQLIQFSSRCSDVWIYCNIPKI